MSSEAPLDIPYPAEALSFRVINWGKRRGEEVRGNLEGGIDWEKIRSSLDGNGDVKTSQSCIYQAELMIITKREGMKNWQIERKKRDNKQREAKGVKNLQLSVRLQGRLYESLRLLGPDACCDARP
jgi:hypothetical protein